MTGFQIFVLLVLVALVFWYVEYQDNKWYERIKEASDIQHRRQIESKRSDIVYMLGGCEMPVHIDDIRSEETTFPVFDLLPDAFRSRWQTNDEPNIVHDKRSLELGEQPFIEVEPTISKVDFDDIMAMGAFPSGDIFLHGTDAAGQPISKSIKEMGSMGILGGSGEGKSTYTRLLTAQAKMKGFEIYLADPEVGVSDESLADSLASLGIDRIVSDNEDIEALSEIVTAHSRSNEKRERPLLFIVDEISDLLSQDMPNLLEAMLAVNRKGRKRNVYMWALGQDFSAAVLESTVRNVFTSIVSLPTTSGALGRMGSPAFREAIDELPQYHAALWRPGRAVDVFAIPNTTEAHIHRHFAQFLPVPALFSGCSQVVPPPVLGESQNSQNNPTEQPENNVDPEQEQALIRDLYELYHSKNKVYERLFRGKLAKQKAWQKINAALGESNHE